jgi:MazG family protein
MRTLRDPDKGCSWDIEQDFSTVVPHTIEEAYEVDEAIRKEDFVELKEELGDLLLHVVFHSQIAEELGLFDFDQVAMSICKKMISRHPHVFQKSEVRNIQIQRVSWELQKADERKQKSAEREGQSGTLDDVALALPALIRAQKLSKRAALVGFDWQSPTIAWKKVEEEICEIKEEFESKESTPQSLQEEFGDLLFALCSWARKLGLDAEVALRDANSKFINRFEFVEDQVNKSGELWNQFSLEDLMRFWEEGKKSE